MNDIFHIGGDSFRSARVVALNNVIASINLDASLPEPVFRGDWAEFLFFESDRIVAPSFIEVVGDFLAMEGAVSCCLLNLTLAETVGDGLSSAIFIEATMTAGEYDEQLRYGGPAHGWLFGVDRYGCASDRGEWSIYCERENDVAVLGLRRGVDIGRFASPLRKLRAETIDIVVRQDSNAPFPFCSLTEGWRDSLFKHYSGKSQK